MENPRTGKHRRETINSLENQVLLGFASSGIVCWHPFHQTVTEKNQEREPLTQFSDLIFTPSLLCTHSSWCI